MGIEVDVFDPSHHFPLNLLNRFLLRTGSLLPYKAANRALLLAAGHFRPDIAWVFKGVEFMPETLLKLKQTGIKLANYNPDHPFIRTSVSHGGKNVETSVPLYDLHFCYSRELSKKIEQEYSIPAAWLPFGYELDEATSMRISQAEEICRIAFVGNPDHIRAGIIRRLVAAGLPVDVYGFGWQRFLSSGLNIRVFDAALGEEFWRKLRQYRVQLNIFRPHNTGSHNMRSFEIPAAGGIMLAPDSPEHRAFFSHGKEAFFYRDEAEMVRYCRQLLSLKDTSGIREQARQRAHQSGYSYEHRARQVFRTFLENHWLPQADKTAKSV